MTGPVQVPCPGDDMRWDTPPPDLTPSSHTSRVSALIIINHVSSGTPPPPPGRSPRQQQRPYHTMFFQRSYYTRIIRILIILLIDIIGPMIAVILSIIVDHCLAQCPLYVKSNSV